MGEENTIDLSKAEDDTGSALSENEKEAGQILEIPLSEIDDFPEHPFRVNLDEDMQLLVDSIRQQGVLTPIMVRKRTTDVTSLYPATDGKKLVSWPA